MKSKQEIYARDVLLIAFALIVCKISGDCYVIK